MIPGRLIKASVDLKYADRLKHSIGVASRYILLSGAKP